MSDVLGTNIIVVQSGHRLYKEDGTDDFLEVVEGQSVRSLNTIYIVEQDYFRLKRYIDNQGDENAQLTQEL